MIKQVPSEAPAGRLLDHLTALSPAALRERVTQLTDSDLDQLVRAMEQTKDVPEAFKQSDILQGIEQQIERHGVTEEMKTKWQALKRSIEASPVVQQAKEKAEQGFMQRMMEKGNGWAVVGSAAIAVLSWFGFSGAKKLRASIKEKGYLRTAVEGAKEHPIFTALIAALGIKAGTDAYAYFTDNKEVLESQVAAKAQETGRSIPDTIDAIANRTKQALATGVDMGLKGLVKGLSLALGGRYDEETGVVTLPGATLRPPVMIAWQAGIRRRGGPPGIRGFVSTFIVENRLNAILRQTDVVMQETQAGGVHKKRLAERALDLMKTTIPGTITAESLELERILETLADDLKVSKDDMIREARYKPHEAQERVKILESEMERLHKTEITDFNKVKDSINNKLLAAEKELASGDYKGSSANRKQDVIDEVQTKVKVYQDELTQKKLSVGEQLADALNRLSGADGTDSVLRERGLQQLDTVTAGGGWKSAIVERTTKNVEHLGYGLRKLPGGRLVVGGLVGYSLLPLALEGVAALRAGENGAEARKAVTLDATEAGLGFVPVVGEAMDLRAAIMGTDLNGRELSTLQRVTSGAMGTLGAVSIGLGFFTGGLSVVGFRALRGALASRKAVKTLKLAENGVEIAGVTQKSIAAIRAGEKNMERLESMLEVTDAQRKLRRMKNVVDNAQRTMQITTYAHLGYSVASGAMELYGNAEHLVTSIQNKGAHAIDAVSSFVHEHSPSA